MHNFVRTVLVTVLVRFDILINITVLFKLCLIKRIREFAGLTLLCSNLIVCCARNSVSCHSAYRVARNFCRS